MRFFINLRLYLLEGNGEERRGEEWGKERRGEEKVSSILCLPCRESQEETGEVVGRRID